MMDIQYTMFEIQTRQEVRNVKIVGKQIKEARKKCGLTQAQLAEKAGISRSYLADTERGSYNPSLKTLLKIAEVCNVDLNFLVGMLEIQTSVRRDA